jgi:3-hydroxyacyl-[acyl-carrier-protein] dehydratase
MRFILIDRIESLEPGRRATGVKQIDPADDYFRDHFPGFPVVPGVLLVESLAQLGGRLVEASVRADSGRRVLPMLAKIEQAKFLRSVRPGDRLDLTVEVVAIAGDAARVTGTASVAGRRAATAALMYAMIDFGHAGSQFGAAEVETITAWSDRVWRELRRRGS